MRRQLRREDSNRKEQKVSKATAYFPLRLKTPCTTLPYSPSPRNNSQTLPGTSLFLSVTSLNPHAYTETHKPPSSCDGSNSRSALLHANFWTETYAQIRQQNIHWKPVLMCFVGYRLLAYRESMRTHSFSHGPCCFLMNKHNRHTHIPLIRFVPRCY